MIQGIRSIAEGFEGKDAVEAMLLYGIESNWCMTATDLVHLLNLPDEATAHCESLCDLGLFSKSLWIGDVEFSVEQRIALPRSIHLTSKYSPA